MKKFTKTQWKNLPIVTETDQRQAQIREDDGNMWIWKHSNGKHVWAERFHGMPFRNDLHRIMSPWFKRQTHKKTANPPVGWR